MSRQSRTISVITGRVQGPLLRYLTWTAWALAGIGVVTGARWAGLIALLLIVSAPLARVVWLIFRWLQERDYTFVWLGMGLLAIVGLAAVIAISWQVR